MRKIKSPIPKIIMIIIYGFFAYQGIQTVYHVTHQPPNQVFGSIDGPGIIGGVIFTGIILGIAVSAVVFGLFCVSKWRIAFIGLGVIIFACIVMYPFFIVLYEKDWTFHPPKQEAGFFTGEWADRNYDLRLNDDSTFSLDDMSDNGKEFAGNWRLDGNKIYLTSPDTTEMLFEVSMCDSIYFLTYNIPGNFDAWNGYLGLMKVE